MRLRDLVRDDERLGRTQVERVGDRVLLPFQLFARRQASGGLLLLVCAVLPDGVSWRHLLGTSFLAGIGFTMALFISGLAFPGTPFESQAKRAILLGSLLAATVGIVILLTTRPLEPDSP